MFHPLLMWRGSGTAPDVVLFLGSSAPMAAAAAITSVLMSMGVSCIFMLQCPSMRLLCRLARKSATITRLACKNPERGIRELVAGRKPAQNGLHAKSDVFAHLAVGGSGVTAGQRRRQVAVPSPG